MSKENKRICGNCKHYEDCLKASSGIDPIDFYDEDCGDWEAEFTEEELEAQAVDAAERENHRKEVED